MKLIIRFFSAITLALVPFVVLYAAGGLVPCDGPECDLCSLVALAQKIMNFLIFIAVIIATIMFVYAGFTMLVNADNAGKRSEGKKIAVNVFIGLVAILAAWLVIDMVMKILFVNSDLNRDRVGRPWQDILCEYQSVTPPPEAPTAGGATAGAATAGGATAGGATAGGGAGAGHVLSLDDATILGATDTALNPGALNLDSINAESADLSTQLQAGGLSKTEADAQASAEVRTRAMLLSQNITINKDPCMSAGAANCTDTRNFTMDTLNAARDMRGLCSSCQLVITGGTETGGGHTCTGATSHCAGDKFDVRPNSGLNTVVQAFTPLPVRSDGATQFKDPTTGNIWAFENGAEPHWDVLVVQK